MIPIRTTCRVSFPGFNPISCFPSCAQQMKTSCLHFDYINSHVSHAPSKNAAVKDNGTNASTENQNRPKPIRGCRCMKRSISGGTRKQTTGIKESNRRSPNLVAGVEVEDCFVTRHFHLSLAIERTVAHLPPTKSTLVLPVSNAISAPKPNMQAFSYDILSQNRKRILQQDMRCTLLQHLRFLLVLTNEERSRQSIHNRARKNEVLNPNRPTI